MAFLRWRRAARPSVIRDRCWDDPGLDALADRMQEPGPPQAAVHVAVRALAATRADPDRQLSVAWIAAEELAVAVDAVAARAAVRSDDYAADVDAQALLGLTLACRGWQVRGSGWGPGVGEGAAEIFLSLLAEADEAAARVRHRHPGHPVASVTGLVCARALGLPMQERSARFEEVRAVHPRLWEAHRQHLQNLCRKWSGSHEMMLVFARRTAFTAPVGDPLGALLAEAWSEVDLTGDGAGVDGAGGVGAARATDVRIVADAADRWVAGGERALAHPAAAAAHNLFGWFLAADPVRARFHLERTRGRVGGAPWDYLGDPEGAYRAAMRDAGVPGW